MSTEWSNKNKKQVPLPTVPHMHHHWMHLGICVLSLLLHTHPDVHPTTDAPWTYAPMGKNNIILPHLLLRDLPPWPLLTFLFGLSLYGFVFEFLNPSLDHHWYVTVKMAVNADVLMLVSFTM